MSNAGQSLGLHKSYVISSELMESVENIKEKITSQEYLDLTNLAVSVKQLEDETLYLTVMYPILYKMIKSKKTSCYTQKTTLLLHKTDFDLTLWDDLKEKLDDRFGLFPVQVQEFKLILPEYHYDHLINILNLNPENQLLTDESTLLCHISKVY
jgi:hypothetical protein